MVGGVGIGVDDDIDILLDLELGDVDLGDVAAHDHLARIADLEQQGAPGKGGEARGDHLADLDAAADDDAADRRQHAHLVQFHHFGLFFGPAEISFGLHDIQLQLGQTQVVLGLDQAHLRILKFLGGKHLVLEQRFFAFEVLLLFLKTVLALLDHRALSVELQGLVGIRFDDGHELILLNPVSGLHQQFADLAGDGGLHLHGAHQLDGAGFGQLVHQVSAFYLDGGEGLLRFFLLQRKIAQAADGAGEQQKDE